MSPAFRAIRGAKLFRFESVPCFICVPNLFAYDSRVEKKGETDRQTDTQTDVCLSDVSLMTLVLSIIFRLTIYS